MMAMRPAKVQKMAAVFERSISNHDVHKKRKGGQAYINPGKPLVTESRDSIAQDSQGKEDQEDLVSLPRQDTDTRALLEDIDTADDEEGGTKVDGESDGDVSNEIEPATDPASNATPSGRREHKGLVVNTCSITRSVTCSHWDASKLGGICFFCLPPAVG